MVEVGPFTVIPGTPLATNHYGYSSTAPAVCTGRPATFTIGSNDYTVNSLRVQFGGRNSGSLGFELLDARRLTTVEVDGAPAACLRYGRLRLQPVPPH